jgi:hypothetical protein
MRQSFQVRLEDSEVEEIREIADRMHLSVDEWIRWVLVEARKRHPNPSIDSKLRAVQAAVKHEFPTGDIGQLLHEVDGGYDQIAGIVRLHQ